MPAFAKLFGAPDNQVLVKLDADPESHAPEVRIYFQPPSLGVCSFALGFPDSEEGWDKAEAAFAAMDEAEARRGIQLACAEMHIDFAELVAATQESSR